MLSRLKFQIAKLVDEILDRLPPEVWISATTTFLDPAIGGGQFVAEIERRLRAHGHSDANIRIRVFGYERGPVAIQYAVNKHNLVGDYTCKTAVEFLELDSDMKFDVIVGNPPYGYKRANKRGPGGDNSIYLKFINRAMELVSAGGWIAMINPPSGITKSTENNRPTPTLKKLLDQGCITAVNFDASQHFSVGSAICWWIWQQGVEQGSIEFTLDNHQSTVSASELYFLPPRFSAIELQIFRKIMNNQHGSRMVVTRGENQPVRDWTMNRMGYPKITQGGTGVLGFSAEFAPFLTSALGLWLLDFIRRHDSFIYHNILTGIRVPAGGFLLTPEEQQFIAGGSWRNFGVRETA